GRPQSPRLQGVRRGKSTGRLERVVHGGAVARAQGTGRQGAMMSGFIDRYLDPADSLGELLFGLIMALTVTLGARLLTQRSEVDARELVVAMVGCNVAWGIIDAVLYLIGAKFSRNRRIRFAQKL